LQCRRDGDLLAVPRERAVAQQGMHQPDAGRGRGGAIRERSGLP
jgi:hypothetical protein